MLAVLDPLREFSFYSVLLRLSETLLGRLSNRIQRSPEFTLEVLYDDKTALDQVLRFCKDSRMAITNLQIHSLEPNPHADYAAEIKLRGSVAPAILVARIQAKSGVVSATDIEISSPVTSHQSSVGNKGDGSLCPSTALQNLKAAARHREPPPVFRSASFIDPPS